MPIDGWNSAAVRIGNLAPWTEFRAAGQSPEPFGLLRPPLGAGAVDYALHNALMTYAYVLTRVVDGRDRLSMLDWEGGPGGDYVYARAMLPELAIDYSCLTTRLLAEGGSLVLPEATFHSDPAAALARNYDLVMTGWALQSTPDWRALLASLAAVADRYLFVTWLPVVERAESFAIIHRPPPWASRDGRPGWILKRDEFLREAAKLGLGLRREFLISEHPDVPGAPETPAYRGFLFAAAGR